MKNNNILWVDFIRVVASFLVVLIHAAAPLLYRYNKIAAVNWWAGNIYDSAARICVPLFFITTGYLLLEKQEAVKDYLTKRGNKILVPLFVWSIFYIFWKFFFENGEPISFRTFYSLFLSPAYFHLWFFYAIIGLYLYIPILRILIQHSPKELLYYFIVLWFIAVSVIPFAERTTHLTSLIDLNMISGFVGYLVIGYIFGNIQTSKKQAMQALFIAFVCFIITIAGTFFLTARNKGEYNGYFYDYLSPNIILYSIAAFTFLKYISEKITPSENQQKSLKALSSASFGIYLIHPMILFTLRAGWLGFSLSALSMNAIYSVPLTVFFTFGLSFLIVFLLQKIPFIRNCVP
jgi:surface polysaccharide O-acyltransferase-like enzyme